MTAWASPIGDPTPEESETVSTLLAMIGGTEAQAGLVLNVYRKNGGNADKAAEALLSGGLESSASSWGNDAGNSSMSMTLVPIIKTPKTPSARQNTPEDIPDLVGRTNDDRMFADDDEDLIRALELSMEVEESVEIVSNDKEIVMENGEEELEDLAELLRKDARPISLRSPTPNTIYAALLLQALFHVPQVRNRLANVQIPEESSLSENSDPAVIARIIELFGNLDLANLARLDCDGVFKALDVPPVTTTTAVASQQEEQIPLLTFKSAQVDIEPGQSPRITQTSNHTYVSLDLSSSSGVVPGELLGSDLFTRLAQDLSKPVLDTQGQGRPSGSTHTVISTPSEVVVFIPTSYILSSLSSSSTPVSFAVPLHNVSSSTPSSSRFSYPSSLYIDPFLLSNIPLVRQKHKERQELVSSSSSTPMAAPAPALQSLDNSAQGQGVLPSLRAALYYYEHVANRSEGEDGTEVGGEERRKTVEDAEKSLRATLEGMEKALKDLDTKIVTAKAEMKALLEDEKLKRFQYDLRAVLMQPPNSTSTQPSFSQLHTVAPQPSTGRARSKFLKAEQGPFVYVRDIRDDMDIANSDVKDEKSKTKTRWWRSPASAAAGGHVEEVSEEVVLSMASPGEPVPYMLIYSKSLSPTSASTTPTSTSTLSTSPKWSPSIVASVELNNSKFMEVLETWRASKQQEGLQEKEYGTEWGREDQSNRMGRDVSMVDVT
ncbi:hypothetical protein J3R30DRAFT_3693433 [Lentinula aciculospora]|uniref:Uncharacterized protein n=1 Tax=Lentinula aciculospora TaxID=153920 RepID=A0A9W9DYL5_9AGAR|nr:hypothetical protein J3R30DRAFT_3693433 [Lentinula aciculospora]